jgi:hypothetical protein
MSAAELDQAHARAAEHRARQRAKGAAREAAQATSVIASPEPAPARALSPREREIAEDRGQIVWLESRWSSAGSRSPAGTRRWCLRSGCAPTLRPRRENDALGAIVSPSERRP